VERIEAGVGELRLRRGHSRFVLDLELD
jgi:hypothetical protein